MSAHMTEDQTLLQDAAERVGRTGEAHGTGGGRVVEAHEADGVDRSPQHWLHVAGRLAANPASHQECKTGCVSAPGAAPGTRQLRLALRV